MRGPLITKIQKYSIHDGTGIRTTVFFKGCPLSCRWCHNPETQRFEAELLFYRERCIGCGSCEVICPRGAVSMEDIMEETGEGTEEKRIPGTDRGRCTACGACVQECLGDARELCGTFWDLPRLVEELLKDLPFYETSGGGVTLSGGEVMAQDPDYVAGLARMLSQRGVSVNLDTCGAVKPERFLSVLPYVDTILFDLKVMDEEAHCRLTGQGNGQILDNLRMLSKQEARIWIRIPVIGGVNDREEEMEKMARFLTGEHIRYEQANLLPYHDTGRGKYGHLDRTYGGGAFGTPSGERMEELRQYLESLGIGPVRIGG